MNLKQKHQRTTKKAAMSLAVAISVASSLVACSAHGQGAKPMGSPASKIKIGMTHLEVFDVMGPWPKSFKPTTVPNWCENFTFPEGDETRYIHVFFDISGKVERVADEQDEPCAIE
jgi:outer membrane protein assembly factor BamE (lipoprotein component of BamABCDE complex)